MGTSLDEIDAVCQSQFISAMDTELSVGSDTVAVTSADTESNVPLDAPLSTQDHSHPTAITSSIHSPTATATLPCTTQPRSDPLRDTNTTLVVTQQDSGLGNVLGRRQRGWRMPVVVFRLRSAVMQISTSK